MQLGNDYQTITTFWSDFSIAELFGQQAVKETYTRVFSEWKNNYQFLTELVMILNHKIWYWYQKNDTYAELYNELWGQADAYACSNLKGEELKYFYRVTD